MTDPSPGESSAWIDDPYRSPVAPLVPASRTSLLQPLRWSLIGAAGGGCLGGALVIVVLFVLFNTPAEAGESEEIGPMLVAMLPLVAAAFVVGCALVGLCLGLLMGSIASMVARPSQPKFNDRSERDLGQPL